MEGQKEEKKLETLQDIIQYVHNRGNDVEIKTSKDGTKVYEVSRKLIKTIKS